MASVLIFCPPLFFKNLFTPFYTFHLANNRAGALVTYLFPRTLWLIIL
jgi:hypothetical protein